MELRSLLFPVSLTFCVLCGCSATPPNPPVIPEIKTGQPANGITLSRRRALPVCRPDQDSEGDALKDANVDKKSHPSGARRRYTRD